MAADGGYWHSATLLTPYLVTHRTRAGLKKDDFNKYLNRFRVRIEHCLANLKYKFPSLNRLPVKIHNTEGHKYACIWIRACCILYNVLLPHFDAKDLNYPEPVEGAGEQVLHVMNLLIWINPVRKDVRLFSMIFCVITKTHSIFE